MSLMVDQMSIRRKTCETTSLLYEAALKTNLSESEDRPANINPTAGVQMRQEFGKPVFVPDASKPGGGIWVAQSTDEMVNSGLPQGEIVLTSDYGQGAQQQQQMSTNTSQIIPNGNGNINPSSRLTGSQNQDFFQNIPINTTNVNPMINTASDFPGVGMQETSSSGSGGLQQGLAGQDVSGFSLSSTILAIREAGYRTLSAG
jgi:hypothetical protein